jgi:PAS domain S-box-containing protein
MSSAPAPSDAPVNILVVDDSLADQQAVSRALLPLRERLVMASTGEEALRALLREDFAVVLLDVNLPDVAGFEAVQLIHSRDRSRHVPVILMSGARFAAADVLRGEVEGAVDYVIKPADPWLLRIKVRTLVRLFRREQALRERELSAASRTRLSEHARSTEEWTAAGLLRNLNGMAYRCRVGRDGPLAYASAGAAGLTGYGPEQLVAAGGVSYADLIHPEDAAWVREAVQAAVQARRPFRCEYRIRTRDGQCRWVWEQGQPIFSDAGALLWVEGVVLDAGERRALPLRASG